MEQLEERFTGQLTDQREIYLLTSLLPPPISLDILCSITGRPPVTILQSVEALVTRGYLSRYTEKGFGYYFLSDFRASYDLLAEVPQQELQMAAEHAVSGICSCLPDSPRKWLHLAHIYLISGLPVRHLVEVVKAGHYCHTRNLLHDASSYYRIALEKSDTSALSPEEKKSYIEAAIGLCSCRENSLSPDIQRNVLRKALEFRLISDNPEHEIKLRMLLARTFLKTIQSDEAAKHLDRAWHMLDRHGCSHEIRLQVALAKSELLFWQGYINKAIEQYESVIGNYEETPTDPETLKSCIRLGWFYGVAGETARGVGLVRKARRKARELGAHELERYATLVLVLILSDAGRIEEGAAFLEEVFQTSNDLLDDYTLWPGYGKKAYFAYCHGDYAKAFEYHKLTYEKAKALGVPHHRGPDNLEVMLGLEERGFFNPEWNFASEIERLLDWPDIFMKGVALRFRALKMFRSNGSLEHITADLKHSIALLKRAGGKIELAQSQLLLARIEINDNDIDSARKLLNSAWEVFAKVNPDLFPKDLKPFLDQTVKYALWVDSLISVGDALGSLRVREELLSQIIKHAMRIAGAERGAIFLRQENELAMVACRNLELSEINTKAFSTQFNLIKHVFESGQEAVRNGEVCRFTTQEHCSSRGWTACFPVQLQTRVLGVIFMDCELTRLHLPTDEIALLRIISNQAAIALENMTAYEEITDLNTSLQAETNFYRENQETNTTKTQMVGRSEPFRQVLHLIRDVADSDTTVLITGETGAGKDLVAQAIHQNSNRSQGPFIAVNVASLSPELIASELFGHEKGSFTGASTSRKGRFELAAGGTLFLDDIDALTLDIQAKLLRVLETKELERVGGTRTLQTDFRLLAASNRNIEELVAQGLFRSDLFYRLNVFPIHIKPLRERLGDIPVLVQHFLNMFAKRFGKTFSQISQSNLDTLQHYAWPGNIRELRHVIERAVLLSKGTRLVIPPLETSQLRRGCDNGEKILPLREMEAQHIIKALSRCGGKVSGPNGAAELLEVKPTTLYSMMKRLGVKKEGYQLPPDSTGRKTL